MSNVFDGFSITKGAKNFAPPPEKPKKKKKHHKKPPVESQPTVAQPPPPDPTNDKEAAKEAVDEVPEEEEADEFMKWVTNARRDDYDDVEDALFGKEQGKIKAKPDRPHTSDKRNAPLEDDDEDFVKWVINGRKDDVGISQDVLFGKTKGW